MKKILLITGLLMVAGMAQAQGTSFPKTWLGQWKGTLTAYAEGGNLQSVETRLILENGKKPDEYYLSIIYSSSGGMEDTRSYTLLADTGKPGHYLISESNGIAVNSYLFGTQLMNQVLVQGHLLTVIYSFEREAVRMRILTANAVPKSTSGGANGIPKVQDFEIISYQDAPLVREK